MVIFMDKKKYSTMAHYNTFYRQFRRHPFVIALLLCSAHVQAADRFDPAFLTILGAGNDVDLTPFSESGGAAPGEYAVSVFINQRAAGSKNIMFANNAQGKLTPLLTPDYLAELGVNVAHIPALKTLPKMSPIDDISAFIPEAKTQFDIAKLRLDISIPQVAMSTHFGTDYHPELWDEGIPALVANYNFSAGEGTSSGGVNQRNIHNDSLYASLRAGVNMGPWRLRSTLNYSQYNSSNSPRHSQTTFNNTYLSRDIIPLRGTLTIGETSTGSDVFDGVAFKGMSLISNEQMLPSQMRGFAPAISGVANSNARVTVRQNGNIVYETYVAQGPFVINDIQQAGMSGDYDVTVTEADGSQRQFTVPYSSLPVMLRPGGWKYEISAGRYDGNLTATSRYADFFLTTLVYGLPQNITLFGGSLLSGDYQAYSLGSGVSLGNLGALSADVTHSKARFAKSESKIGQSWRVRYSKSLTSTGTSVDLTALRYSTRDYFSFNEFNSHGYQLEEGVSPWLLQRRRSSFQTQIRQQMKSWGSLYFRLNRDDYWNSERTLIGLSFGYNTTIAGVSYGINYNIDRIKDKDSNWPENRQISATVSLPFSIFSRTTNAQGMYATASTSHDNSGRTQNNLGLSGSLADNNLSYSLSQSFGNQTDASNSNANLAWQGSKGTVSAGYSYSAHYRAANLNASGGLLVHPDGVLFSRTMGESIALVSAPNAPNVTVNNGAGVTDSHGYAVAPFLSAYGKNNIGLDPSTLPDDVDVVQSNLNVYPTKGAVVKAQFNTRVGYQVLFILQTADSVVPFGAIATLKNGDGEQENSSIVGDGGQVYLTGLPAQGELKVKWGAGQHQQCQAKFDISELQPEVEMALRHTSLKCLP